MKNEKPFEKQANPDPPCSHSSGTRDEMALGAVCLSCHSQSNSPDFPSGYTKQTRYPLKKKEKDITRSSKKEKKEKKWRRLKTSSAVTAVVGFEFC